MQRKLLVRGKIKCNSFIYILAILVLGYTIGHIVSANLKKYTGEKRLKAELESLPLYLKISASIEQIPQKEKAKYIKIVKNYNHGRANLDYELSHSFPSVPKKFRRWECHKYKGEIYVCYVMRSLYLTPKAFIWKVSKNATVTPVNDEARLIDNAISDIFEKPKSNKEDTLKKYTDKEKEIRLFFNDRKMYTDNDLTLYKKFYEIARKKFGVTNEEIDKIIKE